MNSSSCTECTEPTEDPFYSRKDRRANDGEWMEGRKIRKVDRFRDTRQIAPERMVSANQHYYHRDEFLSTRYMFGFQCGARKLVKELKGEHALAILAPSNITGSAEEVHVLVEDPSTRWQTRRRFLIQLGTTPVTYMEGKPKKSFVADSVKVVLTCAKQHTDADAWAHASRNAQELTKKWLKLRARFDFLDVRPPTRIAGATDGLQVIVFVPVSAWIPILRASGVDGIFVRQFIESDHDRGIYRAVPMPVEATLATCLGQAQFLGEKAFGVVPYGGGFGIRVKSADFEEVLSLLQPEKRDQFLGKTW